MAGNVATPRAIARWKLVVVGLLGFTVLGGILEFGCRLYLRATSGYDGKHLYQFAFDPYKNILPTPNYVDTRGIQHNSVGFRRSTEVSVIKPPATYRIFLMGASTGYGLGGLWPHIDDHYPVLKNSETIDAYLERELAEAVPGRKVEVINAAITSTWTHHNLIYLNQTILKYQPDMVLFLDGYNDYYFFEPGHDQFGSYTYSLPSRVILGEPTLFSLAYANGWWLFRKSALVHLLARGAGNLKLLLSARPPRKPIDVDQAVAGQQRAFTANALKMEERCGLIVKSEGAIPVFMLQPMLILERDRSKMTDMERRLFQFNVDSYLPNYEAFITQAVQFVRAREGEMAARVGGTFIDLTGIFKDADGQIYTDYAHLTPRGNQIVAQHIAERILPLIRSQPNPGSPRP
jgi:lysophospholipase L1-like esterase